MSSGNQQKDQSAQKTHEQSASKVETVEDVQTPEKTVDKKSTTPSRQAKKTPETSHSAIVDTTETTSDEIYALVVDDEPANRDFLVRLLEQAGFKTEGAENATQAMEIVARLGKQIQLAMIDHVLPDSKGTDLLQKVHQQIPDATIMMATMHDERSMMREAFDAGCAAFLVKPHGFMELFKRVQGITEKPESLQALHGLIFDQYGPRPWRSGD